MGNIVIRHSKNWNLGDGSVTALHSPGSLINSGQISVPVQLKKEKNRKITESGISLCDLTSFFSKFVKILPKKGEKIVILQNIGIKLCNLTSFPM